MVVIDVDIDTEVVQHAAQRLARIIQPPLQHPQLDLGGDQTQNHLGRRQRVLGQMLVQTAIGHADQGDQPVTHIKHRCHDIGVRGKQLTVRAFVRSGFRAYPDEKGFLEELFDFLGT